MYKLILRALIIAACALILGACVSAPKQQAYNRELNSSIKRIHILPMPNEKLQLFIFNNPGYNFGIIGALVAEGNRTAKQTWVRNAGVTANFDYLTTFRGTFEAAMRERGYELIWPASLVESKDSVKRDAFGYRKKYASVSDADAQLDLALQFVGYAAAGPGDGQPYRPTVNLSVRLLSADGKQVLYADTVRYHNVASDQQAIILEPDPDYAYPDFDDLKKAGPVAIDGLKLAVEACATALAKQL